MVVDFCFGKSACGVATDQNIDAMAGRKMGARGCWMPSEGVPPNKNALNPDGIMNELCLSSPWAQASVAKCKEQPKDMRRRSKIGKAH